MSYPAAGGGGGETFKYWSKNSPTLSFSSTIGNAGARYATAASSTRVVIYSVSEDAWWVVDKSGGSWSVTGWDDNPAPTTSSVDLCATSSTRVYLADATNDNLKAYDIDGSGNFTEAASQALTAGNNTSIGCNSNEDVVVYDQTNNTFWVYNESGGSFSLDETDSALAPSSSSGGNIVFTNTSRVVFQNGNFNFGAISYTASNLAAEGNTVTDIGGGTNLVNIFPIPGDSDSVMIYKQNQGSATQLGDWCQMFGMDFDGTNWKISTDFGLIRWVHGDSGTENCPLRNELMTLPLSATEIAVIDRVQGKMTSYELVDKAYQSSLTESSAQFYVDINNPLSFDSSSDSQTLSDLINSHDFHFGATASDTTDDPSVVYTFDGDADNTFAYLSKSGHLHVTVDGGDAFLLKTISSTFFESCHKDDTNDCWFAYLGRCQRGNHTLLGSSNANATPGFDLEEGNADDIALKQFDGSTSTTADLDLSNICDSGIGTGWTWWFVSFDSDGSTNNIYYYINNENFDGAVSDAFGTTSTNAVGFALMAASNSSGNGFVELSSADDLVFLAAAGGDSFINTVSTIEQIQAEMYINSRIQDPYDW